MARQARKNECGHEDRAHYAHGRCWTCYQRHKYQTDPAAREKKRELNREAKRRAPKRSREYIAAMNRKAYERYASIPGFTLLRPDQRKEFLAEARRQGLLPDLRRRS